MDVKYPKLETSPAEGVSASLRLPDVEEPDVYNSHIFINQLNNTLFQTMFPTELIGNTLLDMVPNEPNEPGAQARLGTIKANAGTFVMNTSAANSTEASFVAEFFYRHSTPMTVAYCVAYILVFAVGLVGNCFVIAVVFRSPRMRTVTNFFIVNLAVADILVIVFCLPATLTSNIFVRKYLILKMHPKETSVSTCKPHYYSVNYTTMPFPTTHRTLQKFM